MTRMNRKKQIFLTLIALAVFMVGFSGCSSKDYSDWVIEYTYTNAFGTKMRQQDTLAMLAKKSTVKKLASENIKSSQFVDIKFTLHQHGKSYSKQDMIKEYEAVGWDWTNNIEVLETGDTLFYPWRGK